MPPNEMIIRFIFAGREEGDSVTLKQYRLITKETFCPKILAKCHLHVSIILVICSVELFYPIL